MKRNIFEEELLKRESTDESAYSMIGTEIKRIRTSQAQTLSSIASDLCSISYLCKIEKAQLKPNRQLLKEICKKLNMSEPKVSLLFELKKYLFEIVEAFYRKDTKKIEELYLKCCVFDNYRSKMIELIYLEYHYDIDGADKIAKELLKITSLMGNDEICVLMVFYAVLCFYQENYLEAVDNLKHIENKSLNNYIVKIAKYFCFQCFYKLNYPLTLLYGQEILESLLQEADYSYAEYIRYLLCLYKINNNMVEFVSKDIENLQNPNYKKSIELFVDLCTRQLKPEGYYDTLRPFSKLIFTYVFHKKSYINMFLKLDKKYFFACDFSYNIASYLSISDDKEKVNELMEVIIPNIAHTNGYFEREFFMNQFSVLCFKFGRYKGFCKAYESLMKGRK